MDSNEISKADIVILVASIVGLVGVAMLLPGGW
jgi:hypothetical protein